MIVGGRRQPVEYIGGPETDHFRQVNANLKTDQPLGAQGFVIEFAGVTSTPLPVEVVE